MNRLKHILSFKHWKLRTKLAVSFILILLIPSISIGISSFQKAQAVLGDEILNSATENVQLLNSEVEDTFETKMNDLDVVGSTVNQSLYDSSNPKLLEFFNEYIELHPDARAIYVGTNDGQMLIQPKIDLPRDFDPRQRGWYKDAMANKGQTIITEPYVDAASQEIMLTVARTTNDGSGVVGIDITLKEIQALANEMKIGEKGYVVILDSANKYLVHPTEEIGTLSEEEWTETVVNEEKGQYSYTHDGEGKEMYFTTNELTGWKILGTMYTSELEDASSGIMITTLIVVAASFLVGILLILIIIRSITTPLSTLTASVKRISEGDLTEPITANTNDEIGQLASSMSEMQDSLREIIQNVSTASENLTGQSEELSQSANEVRTGSEQIASTMQELASGSESQANNASEVASNMSTFTMKVQEANGIGEDIYQSSNEVLQLTSDGSQLMDSSVKQMAMIDEIVSDAVQKVRGLDTQSQEISKLVSVIKDIAEQTNLLALNAAIEAARAGEQGRGFAVVADEVRKLAEQVAHSVTDITGIVGNIQSESSGVVESLQDGYAEVEKGTSQIKTTGETFTGISNAVQNMSNRIQTVTNNLSDIAATSKQMNVSIEEIAAISEESAAGIEQTSASAQQASSSMEEVASSSSELEKLAEELNGLVRSFKL